MARPNFSKIGLRRDRNLSDVENKEVALNNLLNDLVTTGEGQSFSSADLDAIKGISNSSVTTGNIAALSGVAVKNTVLNTETGELEDEVARPLITIKNQLDSIILTTNDPPFFNGGDGLTAGFWDAEDINENLNINSSGANVVIGEPATEKLFWNNGLFEFSNKLDDTLGGSNGAIQWNGFYVPDASGPSTFNISTTGLIIFEIENVSGELEVVKNIYKIQRPVFATDTVVNDNVISVSEQEANTIAINDEVIEIVDNNGNPVSFPEGLAVDGVSNTSVTLNQNVNIGEGYRITFSIENLIGTSPFSIRHVLPDLEKYSPRKIRITYWYPGVDIQYFYKLLDVNLATEQKSGGNLPFWYLYTEIGDLDIEEGFKGFYDKRLLLGGGTIGPEEVVTSTQYNKFQSISPLTILYEPPQSYSDIVRARYTYDILQDSNIISTTNTSQFTDNIEIGNFVVSPVLPKFARVTDISRNSILIVDKIATASATTEFDIIEHRGLIDYQFATSINKIVTLTDTSNLKTGMMILGPQTTNYTRIERIINNRQLETNVDLNLDGTEQVFIYSDKGLRNNSLDNFCIGTLGKEIAATAVAGSTILTLNNVDGISINDVIQSSPFIPGNTTKIIDVDTINNQIEIESSGAITEEMIEGSTVVICPAGTTLNKESCVIPLNTAPPFIGTISGLRTTDGSGNPASKDLIVKDGNLIARDLITENVTSIVELPASGTFSYNRTVDIKCNGINFKVLGTTDGS